MCVNGRPAAVCTGGGAAPTSDAIVMKSLHPHGTTISAFLCVCWQASLDTNGDVKQTEHQPCVFAHRHYCPQDKSSCVCVSV